MSSSLHVSSSVVVDQYQVNQIDVVREQACASFERTLAVYQNKENYSESYFQGNTIAYFKSCSHETLQLVKESYCEAYANGVAQQALEPDRLQDQVNNIGIAMHQNMKLDNPMFDPLTRGRVVLRDNVEALKKYRTEQAKDRALSLLRFAQQQGQQTQLNRG